MLWLVGIGLWEPEDMSLKAYEILKKSDKVYLEDYTAHTAINEHSLSNKLNKKVKTLKREEVENFSWLLKEAKIKNIALAIKGDVFAATTHFELYKEAINQGIKVGVIHGSSIFSAVGKVGLSLYKYGKVISLPTPDLFPSYPSSPFENIKHNKNQGLHSMVLLDIKMHITQGIELLDKKFHSLKLIGCYALGSKHEKIAYGSAKVLTEYFKKVDSYASCIIIPGNLEFYEEEALKLIEISD